MIAALSPVVSWALFLACVAVGVTVYVVVAGGRAYRRGYPGGLLTSEEAPTGPPPIRILGGVYDHEAHEDFE